MRELFLALRQMRRPLVLLAAAVLLLQALAAGFASAQVAARIAVWGADVICHGNGADGSAPADTAAHGCCVFCANPGPAALLSASVAIDGRLAPESLAAPMHFSNDARRSHWAIRAGPSQAPPTAV